MKRPHYFVGIHFFLLKLKFTIEIATLIMFMNVESRSECNFHIIIRLQTIGVQRLQNRSGSMIFCTVIRHKAVRDIDDAK